MTALALSGLAKTYPGADRPALAGLDLTVESGTLTALLGPSGCGKTTAMRLIAGLLRPDAGDILLDRQSVLALPSERRGVAMVFQNPLLFPHLTLAGNLGFGLRIRGLSAPAIAAKVGPMLERVRLQGLGQRRPVELSGGQQQRAALARALILLPKVLLLDEPLSNLDPSLRDEMRGLIRELQRETGITTLIVTHDQAEAVAVADRIALLLDGRIAQHGAPEDFYRRPVNLTVARFFGGANFLKGEVRSGVFHGPLGQVPLTNAIVDGPATLTIRPESLILGPGPQAVSAVVRAVAFLGTQSRVSLDLGGTRLEALVAPDQAARLSVGQALGVTFPAAALWVIPEAGSDGQQPEF